LIREVVFEKVRLELFSAKPSRLHCVFACESLQDARQFQGTGRTLDLIYRVNLVDPDALIHRGCLSYLDVQGDGDTLGVVEQKAERYWEANEVQRPEILTMSPLKILEGPL
jgi:hypothetical protein